MKDIRFRPLHLPEFAEKRLCWTVQDLMDSEWRPKTDTGRIQRFASEDAATDCADQHNRNCGARTIRQTQAVDLVLSVTERGERLVRTNCGRRDLPAETVYHFEPSGKKAPPQASQIAIESGLLLPLDDGLFEELSQTFVHPKFAEGGANAVA